MHTVALVSRKGGCGKSTLATNIAAFFAHQGLPVTLGDLDHQQSMRVWLKRRPSAAPAISGWVGESNGQVRPPMGVTHLVLDTPGGLHGLALAKVAMMADAIVIPVSGSVFDREAASDCWAELRLHPRVVSGRCQVAAVGMRLDRRTQAEDITRDWASSIGLEWLCSLRSSQIYVRAVDNGLSIFDLPPAAAALDREQWSPLLGWLQQHGFSSEATAPPSEQRASAMRPTLVHPLPARASSDAFATRDSDAVASVATGAAVAAVVATAEMADMADMAERVERAAMVENGLGAGNAGAATPTNTQAGAASPLPPTQPGLLGRLVPRFLRAKRGG